MIKLIMSLYGMFLLVLLSGSSNAISSELPPPPAGWKRVQWNPNRDCGYEIRSRPAYIQPDITYTFDIPNNYQLRSGEGVSFISSNKSSPDEVTLLTLHYWGDKHYRESKRWAGTGFNWLDARKEIDYRISVIKNGVHDMVQCRPVTSQIIDGIIFWRADLEIPFHHPVIALYGNYYHPAFMLSDNGTDLLFDRSNPIAEKIVASLRRKQ